VVCGLCSFSNHKPSLRLKCTPACHLKIIWQSMGSFEVNKTDSTASATISLKANTTTINSKVLDWNTSGIHLDLNRPLHVLRLLHKRRNNCIASRGRCPSKVAELALQRLHVSVLVPKQNLVTINNKSPFKMRPYVVLWYMKQQMQSATGSWSKKFEYKRWSKDSSKYHEFLTLQWPTNNR